MAEDKDSTTGTANSAGDTGEQAPKDIGSATKLPDYGQSGQPLPTGVNRTDAPGIDSSTQLGAGSGEPEAVARARAIVEQYDAGKKEFADEDGRLPHVLKSNLDVRRGDEIHRIPAGTVVTDTDLTDDEWDQALAQNIVHEASLSELQAHRARQAQAEQAEQEKAARREAVGVSPKSSRGTKPPRGSHLVANLSEGAAAGALAAAARQSIVAGNVVGSPAPVATPAQVAEAREAGERARAASTAPSTGRAAAKTAPAGKGNGGKK